MNGIKPLKIHFHMSQNRFYFFSSSTTERIDQQHVSTVKQRHTDTQKKRIDLLTHAHIETLAIVFEAHHFVLLTLSNVSCRRIAFSSFCSSKRIILKFFVDDGDECLQDD